MREKASGISKKIPPCRSSVILRWRVSQCPFSGVLSASESWLFVRPGSLTLFLLRFRGFPIPGFSRYGTSNTPIQLKKILRDFAVCPFGMMLDVINRFCHHPL
ncbi:hypothetical protein [Caproicibacter sp. BJN0012]|uniref:hypothetical protein n=1 Tax=Caproicibacter sp. BJN0012 TaxID=3110227 RepID=UPI002E0F7AB8